MASSSGSWLVLLIVLVIGAVLALSANEANFNYFRSSSFTSGKGLKEEGTKLLEDIKSSFPAKKTSTQKKTSEDTTKAVKTKSKINDNQKDDLAHRDREELNELIDKVGN